MNLSLWSPPEAQGRSRNQERRPLASLASGLSVYCVEGKTPSGSAAVMPSQRGTRQLAVVGSALVLSCYLTFRATAFLPPPSSPFCPSSACGAERSHPPSSPVAPPPRAKSRLAATMLDAVADESSSTSTTGGGSGGGGLTDVLARKSKLKEVEALKAAIPADHPIFLELGKVGSYNQSTALFEALKRTSPNTLSVVVEYSRKASWGYLGSVMAPQDYSDVYREAGANAIAVNVEPVTGGCGFEDIKAIVDEQAMTATSRADSLGAVPVVSYDTVVDPFQIARAKLAGATGVTIRYGLNAPEKTKELIDTCYGLGMEPLVQVRDAKEANDAVSMGANLLLLIGNTRNKAIQMRGDLPRGDGVMMGYDLRRPKEYQGGLKEVEDAWVLRDEDFHCVYASDVIWQSGLDDVTGPTAVIRALKAKACHFLVEPLDWIERCVLDGTKETLGELLM